MQERKAAKARPTAKDKKDHAVLLKVARMIIENPRVKPTDALRACGIRKDADLRRLRAKYNFRNEQIVAEARRTNGAAGKRRAPRGPAASPAAGYANGQGDASPGWPSAMSASGAVAVHMMPQDVRAAARNLALESSRAVKVAWPGEYLRNGMSGPGNAMAILLPIMSRMAELGASMMGPQAMGAAMQRQLQLYQLMVRYSPLSAMLKGQAAAADMMLGLMKGKGKGKAR
jgi:hypothetical protein